MDSNKGILDDEDFARLHIFSSKGKVAEDGACRRDVGLDANEFADPMGSEVRQTYAY